MRVCSIFIQGLIGWLSGAEAIQSNTVCFVKANSINRNDFFLMENDDTLC